MYRRFVEVICPSASDEVLDVGVTSDMRFPESNFFEQWYPHKQRITCVGTEDGSHLQERYEGLRFVQVTPAEPLPFSDNQFDIAFTSAVVEHVGCFEQQRAFVAELLRVAKRFFVATPNRWFPVESHTGIPLLHYLPPHRFRAIIRDTRYSFWADERNLNLLDAAGLRRLFRAGIDIRIEHSGVGFGRFQSNLIAYGGSGARAV